jgi:hypothetical protein
VPGGQLQLPHFPVSSEPEAVILSLFPLAQVPAGHEQLPHFPVSPATVKLHKELHRHVSRIGLVSYYVCMISCATDLLTKKIHVPDDQLTTTKRIPDDF